MNILMISPYFSPAVGGVETHLDDLCKYLSEKKHKTYVRTYHALGTPLKGKTVESSKFLNIHRMAWPDFNLIFKLEPYPLLKFIYIFTGLFFDCLFFLLKNSKQIDVIQAHGFIAAVQGVLLGKIFKKKVVINTHVGFKFGEGGLMKEILKWVLLQSDEILVLTNGAKKSLMEIGVPDKKISVYHYWVDQANFKKQNNAKKQLGWEKKTVVLFVGRLITVKGVETIFDLAKNMKNINFAIAGTGPLSSKLEEKSQNFPNVIFLGKINNKDLTKYYSGADVLLIPSKMIKQEYEEGIPRVMIEALSCGLPVVATRTGGIPDVFSNEIGEMVTDKMSDLKNALNKLLNNKQKLNKIAKNCRPFAIKLFSIKNAEIIERSLQK